MHQPENNVTEHHCNKICVLMYAPLFIDVNSFFMKKVLFSKKEVRNVMFIIIM